MTKLLIEELSKSSDETHIDSILPKLIGSAWFAYIFILARGLYDKDRNLIIVAVLGSALMFVAFVLVKRSYIQISSMVTALIVLGTVAYIAVVGQGIRDVAIIAFPIIIIFAGLTLNRRLFGICVGLTILVVVGLVFGEAQGWFVTTPFVGINSNRFYPFAVLTILLFTTLAIDILAKNIRTTLKQTQQEIRERKRFETQNRILSELQEILLRPFKLEDVYILVSEKVRELIGDCITASTIMDIKQEKMQMCSYHGLDIPLEKLIPILGFNPLEKEFTISEISIDDINLYRSGELRVLEGGLYELTAGTVPQSACFIIEKLLRVQKVYGMGIVYKNEFLGSLVILARGDISPYLVTFEQIMNLATIAIDRKRAEDEVDKSEKRFQALIERGRDNISLIAADGKLLWENPSASSTLGYEFNQFVGHNIFELVHPDERESISDMFKQVMQTPGNILDAESRLMNADGTWKWIECTATNLLNDPSVMAIVLNYRDITERKKAEEARYESESRYRTLFENSPVALWEEDFSQVINGLDAIGMQGEALRDYLLSHPEEVIDLMSKIDILDINQSTLQLYGCVDKGELLNNTAKLFQKVSHEALVEELMAMSLRDPGYETSVDNSRSDGKIINVRVRWSVYPGYEERMSRVIVNTVDITQQIQAGNVQAAIYRISQAASSTENLQELYQSIHEILGELMPAKNLYIALYDGDRGIINFPYFVDEYDPPPGWRKFGNGWTEYVIRTGQPLLLSPTNLQKMEEEEGVKTVGADSIDWLGVPLKVEERIIGVVAVQTYTEGIRYTEVEKGILVFVSNQIAMAIERKRAEEQLKYSSTHDPLTGLYNRRYYEEEIKRQSSGRQSPIGAIIMDIDGLKQVNDQMGHAAGDDLLKAFATVIQKEFRTSDVVARLGGDEFGVILPLSSMNVVKKAVERIQKSVERYNTNNDIFVMSFSVGYSTTENGGTLIETINAADGLMYIDKAAKSPPK